MELQRQVGGWERLLLPIPRVVLEGSSDMTQDRDKNRVTSKNPLGPMRVRTRERESYQDAPYRRGDRHRNRNDRLCNNCKRPGHFARDCPNMSVCNNCGLPG